MLSPTWWIGSVENVNDPLRIGRVQVRIKGVHNPSRDILPTEFLPWAQVMLPATSASYGAGIGQSPTGLVVDADVMGIAFDANYTDLRVLFTWYGVGETALLAQGYVDSTVESQEANRVKSIQVSKSNSLNEPSTDRAGTTYPLNDVHISRSGFITEDDNSDGCRHQEIHPKGAYKEWTKEGSIIERAKQFFKVCNEAMVTVVTGTWINQCASNVVQRFAADFYTDVAVQFTVVSPKGLLKHSDSLEINSPQIRTNADIHSSGVLYIPEIRVGKILCDDISVKNKMVGIATSSEQAGIAGTLSSVSLSPGAGPGDITFDMVTNDNGGNYPATPAISGGSFPLSYEVNKPSGAQVGEYWTGNNLDAVNEVSPQVAAKMFDTSLELEKDGCWQIVQRALNAMNRNQMDWKDVEVNGKPNDETMAALKAAVKRRGSEHVLNAINGTQFTYYLEKVESTPSAKKDFRDWVAGKIDYLKTPTIKDEDIQPTV